MIELLQFGVFLTPVILLAGSRVSGKPRPDRGTRRAVFRRTLVRSLVIGYCSIGAWYFADLRVIWAALAVVQILLAGVGAAGIGHSRSTLLPNLVRSEAVAGRTRAKMSVQLVFLGAWFYSWRSLWLSRTEGPTVDGEVEIWLVLNLPVAWVALCYLVGRLVGPKDAVNKVITLDQVQGAIEMLLSTKEYQALVMSQRSTPTPFLQFRKEDTADGFLTCDYPLAPWSRESYQRVRNIAEELGFHMDIRPVSCRDDQVEEFSIIHPTNSGEAKEFVERVALSEWSCGTNAKLDAAFLLEGPSQDQSAGSAL